MKDALKKNSKEIEGALIKPLSKNYPFSTNGIYFFIGKMGTGKSHSIWKHIFMSEELEGGDPYYDLIIFSSTSGELDKTSETFAKKINTPIQYVKEKNLMAVLQRHLRRKNKYYAMVRHVMSKMRESSEEMDRLIAKHGLEDIEDRIVYVAVKLAKYGTNSYPFHTLLILDDFAGSPLFKGQNPPLGRLLTKTRHYNLTAIIVAQTIKFVPLNLKRMATDMIIWSKFSDEDFLTMLDQTPNSLNKKAALEEYHKLTGPHDRLIINITADTYRFVHEEEGAPSKKSEDLTGDKCHSMKLEKKSQRQPETPTRGKA